VLGVRKRCLGPLEGLGPNEDIFVIRITLTTSPISEDVKYANLYTPKQRRDAEELVEIRYRDLLPE
jgi:hypothetical protein